MENSGAIKIGTAEYRELLENKAKIDTLYRFIANGDYVTPDMLINIFDFDFKKTEEPDD